MKRPKNNINQKYMAVIKDVNRYAIVAGGRRSGKSEVYRKLRWLEKLNGAENKLEFERKYEE